MLVAAVALWALWQYATGADATVPVSTIPALTDVPITVAQVPIGLHTLPVRANGYLLTETHTSIGPIIRPWLALAWVAGLGLCLAYWVAVVTTLARPAFIGGMALVIFLLMSLNADLLGVFNSQEQYFLMLSLAVLGGLAFALHSFWPTVSLGNRLLLFGGLVGGLGCILFLNSPVSAEQTALHLASYGTLAGIAALVLLVLWVGFENIRGLLWLNTQAENPGSRFGLLPFLLTSALYLGILALYFFSDGQVEVLPGLHLEPFIFLLTAILVGALGLRQRAASYGSVISYWPGAALLYGTLVAFALASLGYAFGTANDPLLTAARDFTVLAFLLMGAAFLLYVLLNFAPLIRQRLRVYRVVFEPRRFPLYAALIIGLVGIVGVLLRNNLFLYNQAQAGYYNHLGDLTRYQSEQQPTTDALALLAERYYAESDALDRFNHKASLGRAALYHARGQRQNEINALRRALIRAASEKVSLRLSALFDQPKDFFDRQRILQEGLHSTPGSARLNSDLAQLYTRSSLTDSVTIYQQRATALDGGNAVVQSNRLAFLIQQHQWPAAVALTRQAPSSPTDAWQSNALLLAALHHPRTVTLPGPPADTVLALPAFTRLYHEGLLRASRRDTTLLPALANLLKYAGNDAYVEQVIFLRALTQYYGGHLVAAQNTLLPLTAAQSPSAAYYQHLLGLWLLEQGAASTAARHFEQAQQLGQNNAALARAYALALASQPDSARRAATTAVALADNPTAAQALQLLTLLRATSAEAVATSSADSAKVTYLALLGSQLTPAQRTLLFQSIRTENLRQAGAFAQALAALRAHQPTEVAPLLKAYAPTIGTRTEVASRWNALRGQYALLTGQTEVLRQLLAQGYFATPEQAYRLYFRAATAASPTQASRLYQQLMQQAPYLEEAALAAARHFTEQKQPQQVYNVLLRGLEYNPESVPVLKSYILAALEAGLPDYTTAPLAKLRALLSPAEYITFHTQYNRRRVALAPAPAPWH
ncbi:lipopolysaccharide assembly protein LapB [Hymenobacter sp. BT730]|uniref:tetratricopeptide repeat protein n=1 Tax=Hymenobacter sp. BT730 TaxID=3063332 RepID=UPI0026DF98D0|nr:hypothetical protein [Hymenobacter sp. BT730]